MAFSMQHLIKCIVHIEHFFKDLFVTILKIMQIINVNVKLNSFYNTRTFLMTQLLCTQFSKSIRKTVIQTFNEITHFFAFFYIF